VLNLKIRIHNNHHLTGEEKQVVVSGRKKVVSEMRARSNGKLVNKGSQKWRHQSEEFRKVMETNRLISKAEKEGKPGHYYL